MVDEILRITTVSSFRTQDLVYCIAVGPITSKAPEIAACSYDGMLRIYHREGKLKWSLEWSADLTCLALADVRGEGRTALLSGSIDGKVRVFSQRGSPIWQRDLKQAIVCCGAGDIDGDGAAEVVIGLEGKKAVFLDNDGAIIWQKQFREPVIATSIGDFNDDGEVEVIVAEADGQIHLYASSGKERFKLSLKESVANFTLIRLPKETLFTTGDKTSELKFWDVDGTLLTTFQLPPKAGDVKFLTSGPLFESEVDVVILSSRNDTISVLKLAIGPEDRAREKTGEGLEEITPRDFDLQVIRELILSITLEKPKIKLEELDREIRKALNRKVDYNLRELISKMLEGNEMFGHIEGNEFARNISYLW